MNDQPFNVWKKHSKKKFTDIYNICLLVHKVQKVLNLEQFQALEVKDRKGTSKAQGSSIGGWTQVPRCVLLIRSLTGSPGLSRGSLRGMYAAGAWTWINDHT